MRQQALATLLRIRRASLDDAERAVADALREQQHLQTRCEAAEARYAAETLAALDLGAGDEAVDAFARWLPIGRTAIADARRCEQEAAGMVDRTRILLGLTRAAHRSVETLIEDRAAEALQHEERRAQNAMDDLAGRRDPA